jgi:hypothetical protein
MNTKDYSLDAFNRFMDSASKKGLYNKNTAQSRKAAANKVLGVLDESELVDLRSIDTDSVFDRFQNKEGSSYTPDSLQVYKSRLKSALADFLTWVENPAAFRPSGSQKSKGNGSRTAPERAKPAASPATFSVQPPAVPHHDSPQNLIIPVPLREGLTVRISNIPADLTEAEATRLAAILKAYAVV